MTTATALPVEERIRQLLQGPNPTLVSPAAKSPYGAVTGISAKEGFQFYEAAIAIKSMPGISATSCHKGYSLSGTEKKLTMPKQIAMSQLVAGQCVPGSWRLMV